MQSKGGSVNKTKTKQTNTRPPVFQPGQRPVPEALHLQGLSPGRLNRGEARGQSLLVSSSSPQLPKQTLNICFQMEQRLKPLTWFSLSVPALASCQTPAWAPCESESEPRGQLPVLLALPEQLLCLKPRPGPTQASVRWWRCSDRVFGFHYVLLAILSLLPLQGGITGLCHKSGLHSFIPPAVA